MYKALLLMAVLFSILMILIGASTVAVQFLNIDGIVGIVLSLIAILVPIVSTVIILSNDYLNTFF